METTETPKKIHHGRNIRRFREVFGIKQEALAIDLGEDWSQKKVSRLEEKELIEDEILERVANIFHVPVKAIKGFTEEAAMSYFNTFNHSSGNGSFSHYSTFNFHALDDTAKKMIDDLKKAYEDLLRVEREKNALLEKLLAQRS